MGGIEGDMETEQTTERDSQAVAYEREQAAKEVPEGQNKRQKRDLSFSRICCIKGDKRTTTKETDQ